MANTYKNIVITPNIGNTADPKIQFSGGNTTVNTDISLFVYPSSNGTLSFEGSAGQLFSITNDLSGSLFSVNDVSGIPSLEVFANGLVNVAPLGGNVVFGNTSELILSSGAGLYANDSLGTAGQVLHSNGSSVYWAADDDTNTTYDLLHIANTVANEGRIRLKDVNNSNDDIVIVGGGGVTVSSNATAVLVSSVIGDITAVTAGDGLTGGGSTGDVTLNVGAGTGITVSADAVAVNAAYIATIAANSATGSLTNTFTVGTASYFVSNGNLGIGITEPAAKLAIANSTSATSVHIFGTYTNAANYERVNITANSLGHYILGQNAGTGVGRSLNFGANNTTGHMTIDGYGLVGIGGTSTSAGLVLNKSGSSLSVAEGFLFSGDLQTGTLAYIFRSSPGLLSSAATKDLHHFSAAQSLYATGHILDNQFGFRALNLIAAPLNYGFHSQTDSGVSHTITNVVRTNNVVTISTSVAHGYTQRQSVTVAATTTTALNGTYVITSVPSTNTFNYTLAGANIASVADTGTTLVVGRWNFYANGTAPNYFSGNVGIGTDSPSSPLHVASASFPVARIERSTALTSGSRSSFASVHKTTGDMTDSFGTDVSFIIRDNANVDNEIALFGAYRDGADNSGTLIFATYNAGVFGTKMFIKPSGNVGIGNAVPTHLLSVNGTGYFNANLTINSALIANGGAGSAGQVLHSNGTATYWAVDDDTNTTYDLLAIANTTTNQGIVRLKDSANANDDVQFTGANGVVVSSNATHVIITGQIDTNTDTNTTYDLLAITNTAANEGRVRLKDSANANDDVLVTGTGSVTVSSNATHVIINSPSDTNTTYDLLGIANTSVGVIRLKDVNNSNDDIQFTGANGVTVTSNVTHVIVTGQINTDTDTLYDLLPIANTAANEGRFRLKSSGNANDDVLVTGTGGAVVSSNATHLIINAPTDTNTTYDFLAIANTAANEGRIRLKDSANANDDVLVTGTGSVTVSSNATHVIINSPSDTNTTYDMLGIANASVGVVRLKDVNNSNDDIIYIGAGATTVTSNVTHVIISSTDTNTDTNTTYDLLGITNTSVGVIRLKDSANANDDIQFTGANGVTVTSNVTHVIITGQINTDTNTTYDLLAIANTAANEGRFRLKDSANANDDVLVTGTGAAVVSSNATHLIINATDTNTTYDLLGIANTSGGTIRLKDSANANDDLQFVGTGSATVTSNATHVIINAVDTNTDTNTTYDLLALANTVANEARYRLKDVNNSNDDIILVGANGITTFSNTTGGYAFAVGSSTVTVNTTGIHVNPVLSITDLTVSGNLSVLGDTVTLNVASIAIEDSLVEYARNQNDTATFTDALDIGFYGSYGNTANSWSSGLFRDQSDSGVWKIFQSNGTVTNTNIDTASLFGLAPLRASSFGTTETGYASATGGAIANATVIAVGNSTANVVAGYGTFNLNNNLIANSTGVYHTGTMNAASHTVGTNFIANSTAIVGTGFANVTTSVNSALLTVGTAFIANSTAIVGTGYANVTTSVNSALLTVGTNFIANTTGAYHTGVVNAASHTVGTIFIANTTQLTTTVPLSANGSTGTSGFVLTSNGATGSPFWAPTPGIFAAKSANYTAVKGDKLLCDTTAGTFIITLPLSPVLGDTVVIYDKANFSTNPLTVARNLSTIEGIADDFSLDIGQTRNEFVYDGSTWHVYSSIGPRGLSGTSAPSSVAYSIALG